jgi:flagellar export protein FliJ
MPQIDKLINIAGHRSEEALAAWQMLRDQCTDATRKLSLLQDHREKYRDRMRADLQAGMPATAALAYLDFNAQIDEVVVRQQNSLHTIEQACTRQWEVLVEARRDKRTYEILSERDVARRVATALRHRHAEIDDLIQRAGMLPSA